MEHHLKFLSLKGGCPGSSESTDVKMPHCWKSHVVAHIFFVSSAFCLFIRMCQLLMSVTFVSQAAKQR